MKPFWEGIVDPLSSTRLSFHTVYLLNLTHCISHNSKYKLCNHFPFTPLDCTTPFFSPFFSFWTKPKAVQVLVLLIVLLLLLLPASAALLLHRIWAPFVWFQSSCAKGVFKMLLPSVTCAEDLAVISDSLRMACCSQPNHNHHNTLLIIIIIK